MRHIFDLLLLSLDKIPFVFHYVICFEENQVKKTVDVEDFSNSLVPIEQITF